MTSDPFRYRMAVRPRPASRMGPRSIEQVPLTEEDVLFPEEDDFIVQTDFHVIDMQYLRAVFDARLADEPGARGRRRLPGGLERPGCPAAGAGRRRVLRRGAAARRLGTLDVAAEGARPMLVIEITSPSTRKNDVGIKVEFYHRAGVPLYVIADATEDHDEAGDGWS